MKSLVIKLGLFFGMVGFSFWLAVAYNPVDREAIKNNDYLKAMEEKTVLMQSMPGPRIIFAGGSSVAFGTESGPIGDSLGLHGINLGIHAGLGLPFIIQQATDLCREGDILVVSTEYYLSEGEQKMLAFVQQNIPAGAPYIPSGPWEKFQLSYEYYTAEIQGTVKRVQETFLQGKETVKKWDINEFYIRSGFDKHGDYVQHLGKDRPWGLFTRYGYQPKSYQSELNLLNQLTKLKEKKVQLFFVYPPFPKEDFEKNKEAILHFEKQLQDGLQFPILGNSTDFIYPESDFFDTVYHLNLSGREKRTRRLVELLRIALEKPEMKKG